MDTSYTLEATSTGSAEAGGRSGGPLFPTLAGGPLVDATLRDGLAEVAAALEVRGLTVRDLAMLCGSTVPLRRLAERIESWTPNLRGRLASSGFWLLSHAVDCRRVDRRAAWRICLAEIDRRAERPLLRESA